MRTLEHLDHNQRSRSKYIDARVRYYRGSRFFVDLAKHKHLNPGTPVQAPFALAPFNLSPDLFIRDPEHEHRNPGAYLRAAQSVQRFMDLYNAIICSSEPGHQVQHCDVQAAEAASSKGAESLDCIYRITKTPIQQKELKRLIGSMVEEMRGMLQEIRSTFREQMRQKLEQGRGKVDAHHHHPAPSSPERDSVDE